MKSPKIKSITYEPSQENGADMEVPDFVIDTMARCLLPQIQAFYASPEGQERDYLKSTAPIKDDGGRFSYIQINNKSEPVPDGE